jgi:hypothetical protein
MPRRRPPNPLEPLLRRKKKKQPNPLTVRLPPQMLQELAEVAKAENLKRNAVVVTLLRYGLDAYQKSRGAKPKRPS